MTWLFIIRVSEFVIGVTMAWIILRRHRPPVTALAWLMLVLINPFLGAIVYLLLGINHLGRFRAKEYIRTSGESRRSHNLDNMQSFAKRPEIEPTQKNMIAQAERISGNPIVGKNKVELIPTIQQYADMLIKDIDNAQYHIHLLYYIYRSDEIGDKISKALIRAAKRGVKCRLLVDATGSRQMLRSAIAKNMKEAGVQITPALPVMPLRTKLARIDLRNHRKTAVIDGKIAYSGSHNIVKPDYGHKRAGRWIDLSARFSGPVVTQLQSAFLQDWDFETNNNLQEAHLFPPQNIEDNIPAQVVPTGPSNEAETYRRVLLAALNSANQRIIMTTPYLVPDEPMMLALAMAADRGVDTTIIIPEKSDHPIVNAAGRSYFSTLLTEGVNIHLYHGGMLHSKTITVDDSFALIGSANLDVRSFNLNFEINVLLYGAQITHQLRFAQSSYLAQCQQVDLNNWQNRSNIKTVVDNAAALLSPLL